MKPAFLFFLFFTITSFSQNVQGIVINAVTKEPLEGVNVYAEKIQKGVVTDKSGAFELHSRDGFKESDSIYFSHVGFTTKGFLFSQLNERNNIIISLSEETQTLAETEVESRRVFQPELKYTRLASMETGISSFGSLLIDDKIYVIGGDASILINESMRALDRASFGNNEGSNFLLNLRKDLSWTQYSDKLQIYDFKEDVWIVSDLEFESRAYHNLNLLDDQIYVLGGKTLSHQRNREYLGNHIEVYNPEENTLLIDHSNPHQAVNFASFTYKDNLLVMGGSIKVKKNGRKIFSQKVHLYDRESGYWYELNDMPEAKETKGILVGDKIYLIGGFNGNELESIESFDLVSGRWKREGFLPRGISKPGLTAHNNLIYIFDDKSVFTYDIATKRLNEYAIDLDLKFAELFYRDNKIYLVGGVREIEFSKKPSAKLYAIDLKEFDRTAVRSSKEL